MRFLCISNCKAPCNPLSQMVTDLVLEGLLREHLMVSPLLVVVGITEQLVTMGAEDFKVTLRHQTIMYGI